MRVYDPFMGGGTTLVEASRLGAAVSGTDIDPTAHAIVSQALAPGNADEITDIGNDLLEFLRHHFSVLYPDEGGEQLHSFWLAVVTCPACQTAGPLYRSLVLARDSGKSGAVVRDDGATAFDPDTLELRYLRSATQKSFRGRSRRWAVDHATFRASRYRCPKCGTPSAHRELQTGAAPRRLIAVERTPQAGRRRLVAPAERDLDAIDHASELLADPPVALRLPDVDFATTRRDPRPRSFGVTSVRDLFTARQLLVLGAAHAWIESQELSESTERGIRLALSNALVTNNRLCSYATDYGRLSPLYNARGYSVPALPVELNPLHSSGGRGTLQQCLNRVARSATATVRRRTWNVDTGAAVRTTLSMPPGVRDVDVRCSPAADSAPATPIDLLVFDPPYYDYIIYDELAELFRAWNPGHSLNGETLQSAALDDPATFGRKLAEGLRPALAVREARYPLAFTYHSSSAAAWEAIGVALDELSLRITALWPVRSDGHMSHRSRPGHCAWDVVVVCRPHSETSPAPLPDADQLWNHHLGELDVGDVRSPQSLPSPTTSRVRDTAAPLTAYDRKQGGTDGCHRTGQADQKPLRRPKAGRGSGSWGEWEYLPVIRVPVAALEFNIDNRRFAAERQLFEEQLERSLDPENSDSDARSVEAILLDGNLRVDGDLIKGTPGKDYNALRADWQRRKQESPFWIRADGTVRNGNRRLAMLRRLRRQEGADGYEHVDAVVLDELELDELAIFEMEQREQLTEDYKVRYSDINLLLAIRDAATDRGIDWYDPESVDAVAGELQHVMRDSKSYAVVQLGAIKYMDAYLEDMDIPGRYDRLIRQIERFRDVGKIMRRLDADDPERAPAMLDVLFAAVNAGLTHGEIRAIKNVFDDDPEGFGRLAEAIRGAEADWHQAAGSEVIDDPELVGVEVDDPETPEDDRESPGPAVKHYPKSAVKRVFDDAFDRHKTQQSDDVLAIVAEINTRLDSLVSPAGDRLSPALQAEDASALREAVQTMSSWFDRYGSSLT